LVFAFQEVVICVFLQGNRTIGKKLTCLAFLIWLITQVSAANTQLYVETFTGEGDVNLVGWTGVYDAGGSNGGVVGGFCWIWHNGDCENLIYTTEYTVDTSTYSDIEFKYDLRRHSGYSSTPQTSITVQVGGSWYVSKTIYTSTSTSFATQTFVYDPNKENWDTLNIATAERGSTASADLSGDITGFGLYSNSQNVGGSCTAEYDNFIVNNIIVYVCPDFTGDGVVDFLDFSKFASAWLTTLGEPDFNENYDLDDDNDIDINDLALFAEDWLLGAKYPYSAPQTNREKLSFNTGWKFYKGNAGADFEHIMMEEVGTVQGQNNWYFGVSTSSTGPRDALMTFYPNYWPGWGSCWNYPAGGSGCLIFDGRYVPEDRDPKPHTMETRCHESGGYLPRVEWVSSHADNSSVKITGMAMSHADVGNIKARILQNGTLVWESSNIAPWKSEYFVVDIADLDNGDIITFMQSSWVAWSNLRWHYATITESASDPNASAAAGFNDSSWDAVHLPHNPVVDQLWPEWPTYSYEGVSWYRKRFSLDNSYQGKKIFIEFEGANVVADVWLNGTYLTTHYGGYLPFTVDTNDYANFGATENVIAVKVDNTWNADVPGVNGYGGIYRDVWIHITDKLHVTDAVDANIVAGGGIFVTYSSVSTSKAQVQVKTHVVNEYSTTKVCTVKNYIVDADNMVVGTMSDTQSIGAGSDYTFSQSTTVYNPCLWHPDHPYLYTVYTEVYDGNSSVDSYQTRVGIRSIEFTKAEGFKINGEVLRFRGANRVQDYPYVGYAMGNLGQRRDVLKLKEAGFEYVRTSHCRPHDPAFLDACDELGLMVLDPIPGTHYIGGTLFKERSYQTMRDLIRRDRNHPCVIAWELSLNETWWTDPDYTPTAVSIGHAEYPGDQCYVAGWKDGGMWGEPALYDIFICTPSAGAEDYTGPLPLIVSEHGHWEYGGHPSTSDVHRAAGLPGPYGGGEADMLQQAWNHQESHHLNRGLSNMCGDGVWVGMDYMAYPSGVLDKFRLPKFSCYFWQSQRDPNLIIPGIDSGPMVYIANYWTSSSPTDVRVYSNCDQVKLYINDVLQDTRNPDTSEPTANLLHPPFTFASLTWQSGELKAEGLIGDEVVATHIVNTPGSADSLLVEFDITDVPANGSETIFVYASILDTNGTVVPDASNEVTFSVTGQASLVSPATVDAEAGIATALIRVSDLPGLITVTATASGLDNDNASITSE